MTGEALYARYCKAVRAECSLYWDQATSEWRPVGRPLPAWPFLSPGRRTVWNELAKTVQHKPKRRRR